MLKLWRKAHLFDPQRANLSTWLFRVTRNLYIDHVRREPHWPGSDGVISSDGGPEGGGALLTLPRGRQSPQNPEQSTTPYEDICATAPWTTLPSVLSGQSIGWDCMVSVIRRSMGR